MSKEILTQNQYQKLLEELRNIIESKQQEAKKIANNIVTQTYWLVGKKIFLKKLTKNGNYQNLILNDLSKDLAIEISTLRRATKFFETYPNGINPKSNLSWSHYKNLIAVKNDNLREKLEKKSEAENWSTQKLTQEIAAQNLALNSELNPALASKQTIKRPTSPNYLYKAKILNVVDGDTLILEIDLGFQVKKEQRVRLAQINAAELDKKNGKKAFYYLRDLAAKIDEILIKTNKVDIYGRFIGDIFYLNEEKSRPSHQYYFENGVYLNQELVEANLAEIY